MDGNCGAESSQATFAAPTVGEVLHRFRRKSPSFRARTACQGLALQHFLIPIFPDTGSHTQGPVHPRDRPTFCREDGEAEKQDAEQAGED